MSGTAALAPQPGGNSENPKDEAPWRLPGKKPWLVTLTAAAGLIAVAAGAWYWWQGKAHALPPGIFMANGRLEAERVEIAAKYAGRIAGVFVREGQLVDTGETLARMDTSELEAQLTAAKAKINRAEHEETQARAAIVQRESERTFARRELERAEALGKKGWVSSEKLEERRNALNTAEAAYNTAVASLEAAKAVIAAERAEAARLETLIKDATLIAPRRGRIQYRLAQAGEVLAAGGRVLTLLDLTDVYMTVFLPAHAAGPLAVGDEARIQLDPVPQYIIPAKVTFVATEAQFTPKSVETKEEREKLMFRVKLSISPSLLKQYEEQVKTGVRGIAYVRTSRSTVWPGTLAVKLP